jgi:serine/threonine protein kinase
MSLTVGETVGPYRVVEQLGQGGMATVFKAYHAALDWIIREARCDLDNIKTQRANAKVEASCVDLSLLLTGK